MKTRKAALRRITHHSINVTVALFLPNLSSVRFLCHGASIAVSLHCPHLPVRVLGLVNSVDFGISGAYSKPLGVCIRGSLIGYTNGDLEGQRWPFAQDLEFVLTRCNGNHMDEHLTSESTF